MSEEPRRSALILSGGGAYGAYQVGVLKALTRGLSPSTRYRPFSPDVVAGTSVGAFNAAFLVSHWERDPVATCDRLARVWLELLSGQGLGINGVYRYRLNPLLLLDRRTAERGLAWALGRLAGDAAFITRGGLRRLRALLASRQLWPAGDVLELVDVSKIFDTRELADTLRKTIDFAAIRRSPIPLRIPAIEWGTGRVRVFTNRDMSERRGPAIIRASSAIPGIFPPHRVGAKLYVDGGILANTPLQPAIDAGANDLHLVYLYPLMAYIRALGSTVGSIIRTNFIVSRKTAEIRDELLELASSIGDDIVRGLGRSTIGPEPLADYQRMLSVLFGGDLNPRAYAYLSWHNYYPSRAFAHEPINALDFERHHIAWLIDLGFRDTAHRARPEGRIRLRPTIDYDVAAGVGATP